MVQQTGAVSSPRAKLKSLLQEKKAHALPGVVNALFARMAEKAGFRAVFAPGSGISNAAGLPDIGLLSSTEVALEMARIASSVGIPVLADGDTGYGGSLNVYRSVSQFVAAGVAAVSIEDQAFPKRSAHMSGKNLVSISEMCERIAAAKEAMGDTGTMLIGRVEGIAVEGFKTALDRAKAYEAAGADIIFITGAESVEQLKTVGKEISAFNMTSVIEGGKMPALPLAQFDEFGYDIVLYANAVLRMAMSGAEKALAHLHQVGDTSAIASEMYDFQLRQAVSGLGQWRDLEEKFRSRAEKR